MRDAPLCIDCRHFIREGMLCSHPTAFQNESVIAGTARMGDARWARHVGECGEAGVLFEPTFWSKLMAWVRGVTRRLHTPSRTIN
jgi:hypothetical protein